MISREIEHEMLMCQPLQAWIADRLHPETGELEGKEGEYKDKLWNQSTRNQVLMVRDEIHPALTNSYVTRQSTPIRVASTHTSKSCILPVYYIDCPEIECKLWMRGNFYDWKVSVSARPGKSVPDNFFRLFDRTKEAWHGHNPVYFEGFKDEWIYGPYEHSKWEFSLELGYRLPMLFTFCFLLSEGIRANGS